MKMYLNTKVEFGEAGPFEAESKETLADEGNGVFLNWADESWRAQGNNDTRTVADHLAEIRQDFIDGLEEVTK
jgi:hypothetical protein